MQNPRRSISTRISHRFVSASIRVNSRITRPAANSPPVTTEIAVVASLKVEGTPDTPDYQLEIESPAGGVAKYPIPLQPSRGTSSVAQLNVREFQVKEPGVFKFRVKRDGKLVAARELPVSAGPTTGDAQTVPVR